jgi:cupin 2 domain-containing protein
MLPDVHSLLTPAATTDEEIITPLLTGGSFRAEHIASFGHASPPGHWYDQDQPEWVALIKGTASLQFDDGTLQLQAGDHLTIPARMRHRVTATSADAVWLALHFQP